MVRWDDHSLVGFLYAKHIAAAMLKTASLRSVMHSEGDAQFLYPKCLFTAGDLDEIILFTIRNPPLVVDAML